MSGEGSVEPGVLPDGELLDLLCDMWDEHDPVPPDLADRVSFVLMLDDLEIDLLRLETEDLVGAGARTDEQVRTVTFSSDSLSVMVSISHARGGDVRVDGWISDGGRLQVELRQSGSTRRGTADDDGRFVFDGIGRGLIQLVFLPTAGAARTLPRSVVTPAVQV